MVPMQNENLDDTSPTPVGQDDNLPSLPEGGEYDDGQTTPTRVGPADDGQTVATPVAQAYNSPASDDAGLTVPTPVGPADSSPESFPAGQTALTRVGGAGNLLPPPPKRRGISFRSWSFLGLLALILIAIASAFSGYRAGIHERTSAEAAQLTGQAEEQFNLALNDLQAGQFERARQRLDYVIRLNPNYPGVTEKMAEVMLLMNTTATPTPRPLPTLTPTPDLRGVEELYSQAQQYLSNTDWAKAVDTLLALRKADPNYQPVWVDGRLYVAYRNSGADKILKKADLEGGIYDLTLAGRFGLLDADAQSYMDWAGMYIKGASFWDLDWGQAVFYFGQIAPALPNLTDGSGWTATERYRLALINYGDFLAGRDEWCDAQEQYGVALTLGSYTDVEDKYAEAENQCGGGGDEEEQDNTPEEATEAPPVEVPPEETPTAYP